MLVFSTSCFLFISAKDTVFKVQYSYSYAERKREGESQRGGSVYLLEENTPLHRLIFRRFLH